MNKTAIRNFAIWARNKLIADVSYKAGLMGITSEGISDALSQSTLDVEFYDIGTSEPYAIRGEEIKQRKGLVDIIRQKEKESDYATAYSSVIEEVAYTWFNRLIAVRFMEVNNYMPSHVRVLSSETGKLEPDLVTTPFDAELDFSDDEKQQIIQLKNDNKLDEAFRLLFIKQCNALYGMLPRLFENTSDYSELLLNVSFVDQDGVVYHLVHDIDEDDFNIEKGGQVEIIGWLYQYYNAELKDETFALLKNNVKVTKERVPSATQLFTPDWIVRYMVENSLGRLWIEGHPNDILKSGWKYYLDEAEQETSVKEELEKIRSEFAKLNPEDIKVIDPCMGSGHILVYAFDVLMQIYESAGYTQRDAAKSILEQNLFGLDIDDRAAQLAYFAVMMKARQYNRRILDGKTNCNVYAIKESNNFDRKALIKLGDDLRPVAERLLDEFVDAKEYGSIISVDMTLDELDALDKRLDEVDKMADYGNLIDIMYTRVLCTELNAFIKQARVFAWKYNIAFTNPPYLGIKSMGENLVRYVGEKFELSKNDLCCVFVERIADFVTDKGFFSMILQQAFIYASSFSELRRKFLAERRIVNVLQLGLGTFGTDFGTVAYVASKKDIENANSVGIYLGTYKEEGRKEEELLSILKNGHGKLHQQKQDLFNKLPNNVITYRMNSKLASLFETESPLGSISQTRQGLATSDNNRFIRLWMEVLYNDIRFTVPSKEEALKSGVKWFPFNKGGAFRRWYGNRDYVVNWQDDGREMKELASELYHSYSRTIKNEGYYFKKAITWSDITSGCFSGRIYGEGTIFSTVGLCLFADDDDRLRILGFLNSKVSLKLLEILSPTIHYNVGDMACLPYKKDIPDIVSNIVKDSVDICINDWDSFETSWDFKKHPLI